MDPGERTTGTRDEHYNLIAVLYHALHGAENCEMYAADAEVAGRDELAAFFLEAQAKQIELADRAKELLGIGGAAPGAAGGAMVGGGVAPEDIPPTTDVPPTPLRGEPGDVDRGISPEPSPRMADVSPETSGGFPPDTTPGDIPPRSADVQREAQIRADQVSVPTERPTGEIPPQMGDLRTEATPPDVDAAPPERGEVSPRTEGVPGAEDVPPSLSEEPPEAGRSTGAGETIRDLIRESDRRSRGET